MNKILAACGALGAVLAAVVPALAVDTKFWTQDDMAGFDKGSLTRLSLSSDGKLSVAPAAREVFDASTPFLYAMARDSKGNIYVGGGGLGASMAKLFVVSPTGTMKALADLDGLTIQAIAIDAMDRVYAATSPDGKVYRIEAGGKATLFYDPKAKYIWAMTFDRAGNLFVATGDQGEIYKVTPAGTGAVFFRTDETHARSLAVDGDGNLIVGTEPSGLILRVSPAGRGFVLYQAPKREITAVAVGREGTIYAAGVGIKQAPSQQAPLPAASVVTPIPANSPAAANAAARLATLPAAGGRPNAPAIAGGSEVYRIQRDGESRKIWSDAEDLVYTLAVDSRGRLLAGTGNHGYVYRIDSDSSFTRLLSLESNQVTGLLEAPGGTLYAVTGNIGKLFAIGPGEAASGTYESQVFDAGAFSYWGRIGTEPQSSAGVTFETRSGNLDRPQQSWSPWQKLNAGVIASPAARFLQYRATLTGISDITQVEVAYQMKNTAPVIHDVETTPENYKFPAPAILIAPPGNPSILNLPAMGKKPAKPAASNSAGSAGTETPSNTPSLTWDKGYIGARWSAEDDNGDTLVYSAEIRGVNETTWRPLRDKIRENYFSWDSTAFPDGMYVLRITASDSPSNPPGKALTASAESDPFLIDNTPPVIGGLTATAAAGKVELRFQAKDALSNLGKAEYSVNGGDWMVVEPVTRLTDSPEESYETRLDRGTGEMTIAVRVSDDLANQAVAKTVVK